jgi:hypothetical protein
MSSLTLPQATTIFAAVQHLSADPIPVLCQKPATHGQEEHP